MRVEIVEWTDPCHINVAWLNQEQFTNFAQNGGYLTTSVGFMMYEDEESVVLVQSIANENELVSEVQKILKANILRRTPIGTWETLAHFESWNNHKE